MRKIIWFLALFSLIFGGGQGVAGDKKGADSSENVVAGKLFCSLKRQLLIPFHCKVILLNAHSGQWVEEGDVLVQYRLMPEAALKLRRRVSSFHIKNLEMQLAEVEEKLAKLEDKYREVKDLAQHNMAPAHSLTQIDRKISLLAKKQAIIDERIPLEQALYKQDLEVVGELLGTPVKHGHVPEKGALRSPISGHVIWVNPDLRENAEFKGGAKALLVGVMNPMLIRARVHEIEAVQLKMGDTAFFSTESLPGQEFEAKVNRIPLVTLPSPLDQPSYYEIEWEVPNPDLFLREGLRGRIVFRKDK